MGARTLIEADDRPGPVVFQTTHDHLDHATAAAAIAATEERGSGSVVRFHVAPNLPGLKPDYVYSSTALWSYNLNGNGKWQAHDIHSGHGRAYADELPA